MDDRLEMLDDALWYVNDAMRALKDVGGYQSTVAALEATATQIRQEMEEEQSRRNAAHEVEQRAMNREYWRDR